MPDPVSDSIFQGRDSALGPFVPDEAKGNNRGSLFPTQTEVSLYDASVTFARTTLRPAVLEIENPNLDPAAVRKALMEFIAVANKNGGIPEVEIPLTLVKTGLENPSNLQKLRDVAAAAQEQGFVNLAVPQSLGGMGFSLRESAFVVRGLVVGSSAGMATTLLANDLALTPIVIAGTEDQKKRFVTDLIVSNGQAAFCLTEPNAGSNPAQMQSKLVDKGTHYELSGSKMWITNHVLASELVVFAKDPALPEGKNICCVVVPSDARGVTIGKIEHKLGQHCSPTGEITFDSVIVPKENLIGTPGKGLSIALGTLEKSRPLTAALAWGVTTAAFDSAVSYANAREQGGKPIAEHQLVQEHLASIYCGLRESEGHVLIAATFADNPTPINSAALDGRLAASVAKLRCAEIAVEAARSALQIHGGYGFSEEYPVARLLRDVQVVPVYEGTNEILKTIIAGILNIRERVQRS